MNNDTISLCMIVKNEEHCLERCLESAKHVVDEIIIVDTGSNDRTKQIASRYTQHVYDFEWNEDFAAARNYAIGHATGTYILQLDADEIIIDTNNELQSGLVKDFYNVSIHNKVDSGETIIHQFARLFKNTPKYRYVGALHEQIPVNYETEQWGALSSYIEHDGYLQKNVQLKDKSTRNMRILKKAIDREPSAFNYFNLGAQYMQDNRYLEALEALKKSYASGKTTSFSQKVVYNIIKCLFELKRWDEAIQVGEDALQLYPNAVDLFFLVGHCYLEVHCVKDAERCFKKCLAIGEKGRADDFVYQVGTDSYLALVKLAEIAEIEGDLEEALRYLERALTLSPDNAMILNRLLEVQPALTYEELRSKLASLIPFKQEHYIKIIGALYHLRNPLFVTFMEEASINASRPISVFYFLCKGNYEAVQHELSIINDNDNVEPFLNDVILLGLLTGDSSVFQSYKLKFGLSQQENKWLQQLLLLDEPKKSSLSSTLKHIWKQLIKDLLHLRRYDLLEKILPYALDPEMRYIMSEQFAAFGFYEPALDLLVEDKHATFNYKVFMLAAKSLEKIGHISDALYYYQQAANIKKSMDSLYRMWKLLSVNVAEQQILIREMQRLQPHSRWIHQQLMK
ncbi:glycosyltransferase family 2 protein [Paenibacillus agilis]|uniref:Glycosyltransferase n=1 Tax=Paenibacillus agilis TaxID=3020863 RepID=A0A559IP63_9BACL|nr:glycosyltransferase family 2 protein [Paenibacillus agilis]TVX89442.1 glycosyltransferase [Paenibacillus agilis]